MAPLAEDDPERTLDEEELRVHLVKKRLNPKSARSRFRRSAADYKATAKRQEQKQLPRDEVMAALAKELPESLRNMPRSKVDDSMLLMYAIEYTNHDTGDIERFEVSMEGSKYHIQRARGRNGVDVAGESYPWRKTGSSYRDSISTTKALLAVKQQSLATKGFVVTLSEGEIS